MTDTSADELERSYSCTRCQVSYDTEEKVLSHLKSAHEGDSDGKYDYSVDITSEFP